MINSADLAKAINAVWDASTLDATFQALWPAGVTASDFPVLHEVLAGGEQPWPFCVFEIPASNTTQRMTKGNLDIWEEREAMVVFRVHTKAVSGDVRSPKQIAAYLIEELAKVFGGHPTQVPTDLALDHGNHLHTRLENDFGVAEKDDWYVWTLSYMFMLDVPVMT